MASKRNVRRKTCGNKKRLTKQEALNTAAYLRRHGHGVLDAYRCGLCRWWHVGHRPGKVHRYISERRGYR